MLILLQSCYDGVASCNFASDLAQKSHVILLYDDQKLLRGFSTIVVKEFLINGSAINLLYSGDTVIERPAWGHRALPIMFMKVAGACYASARNRCAYWLLTTKGHRTYRFLGLYFHRYYPSPDSDNSNTATLASSIGKELYKGRYDDKSGIIIAGKIETTQKLTQTLTDVPGKDAKKEEVKYFLSRNPTYYKGDELLCIAALKPENIRGGMQRAFNWGAANPDILL
jgi:hypothetical protein